MIQFLTMIHIPNSVVRDCKVRHILCPRGVSLHHYCPHSSGRPLQEKLTTSGLSCIFFKFVQLLQILQQLTSSTQRFLDCLLRLIVSLVWIVDLWEQWDEAVPGAGHLLPRHTRRKRTRVSSPLLYRYFTNIPFSWEYPVAIFTVNRLELTGNLHENKDGNQWQELLISKRENRICHEKIDGSTSFSKAVFIGHF